MKQQTKPGSALIFTLIILFIGVVAAVGVASTTVISRKMSTTTGKSVASFQVADSGAEIVLQRMKDVLDSDSGATINDLGITCSSGTVSGSINSGKEYRVTFLDENGTQLSAGCNASLSDVQKIRSVGTYAQISRAVEAAVAAGGGELDCQTASGVVPSSGGSVSCPSGYTLTGGGCGPSSGGDITASIPASNGWACSGTGTMTAYAVCCKVE